MNYLVKNKGVSMKRFLVLCYTGKNPFPVLEKDLKTNKTKKDIFLKYKKSYDFVRVVEKK